MIKFRPFRVLFHYVFFFIKFGNCFTESCNPTICKENSDSFSFSCEQILTQIQNFTPMHKSRGIALIALADRLIFVSQPKLQTFAWIDIRSKYVAILISHFCHELVVSVNYRSSLGPSALQMMMKTVMVTVNVN